MLDNMSSLFSICSNVLITIASILPNLGDDERTAVCDRIKKLYEDGHEVMQVPVHVAYAVRVIGKHKTASNQDFLHRCYDQTEDMLVRRDIAATFVNWRNFPWLSIFIKKFATLNEWERRVAIVASFTMKDEGRHWRNHQKARFTPFESIVSAWRGSRNENFMLPL